VTRVPGSISLFRGYLSIDDEALALNCQTPLELAALWRTGTSDSKKIGFNN